MTRYGDHVIEGGFDVMLRCLRDIRVITRLRLRQMG